MHIGVVSCVQRPAFIPTFTMSEAETIVMFKLRLERDLGTMEDMIGPVAERANGEFISIADLDAEKHDFVIRGPHSKYPQYFREVQTTG